MSTGDRLDRATRAWLDLMPDEAPERAVLAVLDAVENTPQRRALVGLWRLPMNRVSMLAGAAVLAVSLVGVSLLLQPTADTGSRNTPSPVPTATPAVAGVPAELQHAWLGELRNVDGLSTDRSILEFGATSVQYVEQLLSTVTASTPGRINLVLDAEHAATGCASDDVGTYDYVVAAEGTKLTLSLVGDACTARGEALAGTWLRSECLNTENFCLGPLGVGEYQSFFFAPRLPDDANWAPDFGALTYTVPTGWAATLDFPRDYFLEPADWYAENRGDIASETRGIYLGSHVVALAPGSSCAPASDPDVARSAEALASWLAAHPALETSEPEPITINGIDGYAVEGAANDAATEICRAAPTPVALLFGEAGNPTDGRAWGAQVDQRSRWILLDIDDGRPLLIEISARAELFDELLPEAMQIVGSFRFE